MIEKIISVNDVYKIFNTKLSKNAVIKGATFDIIKGEKIIIIGPSGSGKTTFIKLLIGELLPSAGSIIWDHQGIDTSLVSNNKLIQVRKSLFGFVTQLNDLIPHLNVKDNIMISNKISNKKLDIKSQFDKLCSILNLELLLNKMPSELSEGEKKRVNIASAMINNPIILIADEIIEGLDPILSNKILDLLDTLNLQFRTTIILTTHNQIVASRGDKIIEINNGIFSAIHSNNLDLDSLDKTRKNLIDKNGRIHLDHKLLEQLNQPKQFDIYVNDGKIILDPDE